MVQRVPEDLRDMRTLDAIMEQLSTVLGRFEGESGYDAAMHAQDSSREILGAEAFLPPRDDSLRAGEPGNVIYFTRKALASYAMAVTIERILSRYNEASGRTLDYDVFMSHFLETTPARYQAGPLSDDDYLFERSADHLIEFNDAVKQIGPTVVDGADRQWNYRELLDGIEALEDRYGIVESVQELDPTQFPPVLEAVPGEAELVLSGIYERISRTEEARDNALEQYAGLVEAAGGGPSDLDPYLPLRLTGVEYAGMNAEIRLNTFSERIADVQQHAEAFSALVREGKELSEQVLAGRKSDAARQAFNLDDNTYEDYGLAIADRLVRLGSEGAETEMETMQQRHQAMRQYLDDGRLPLANRVGASRTTGGSFRG